MAPENVTRLPNYCSFKKNSGLLHLTVMSDFWSEAVSVHAQYTFGQKHWQILPDCRTMPCGITFCGW